MLCAYKYLNYVCVLSCMSSVRVYQMSVVYKQFALSNSIDNSIVPRIKGLYTMRNTWALTPCGPNAFTFFCLQSSDFLICCSFSKYSFFSVCFYSFLKFFQSLW